MKNIVFDILIFLKVKIPTMETFFEEQHDLFSLNLWDDFLSNENVRYILYITDRWNSFNFIYIHR